MIEIRVDDLTSIEIEQVLKRHLDLMYEITPAESVHALDLNALRVPEITFWSAWEGPLIVGCIGLKDHGAGLGEIKSMHILAEHRGRGFARKLVDHLMAQARDMGLKRLSLETGATPHFVPARELYRAFGFEETGPFADYKEDPHSAFMTREIR